MFNDIRLVRPPAFALLAVGLLVVGCGQQSGPAAAPGARGASVPEVSVVVLRPKPVTVTSELPGRVTAYLTAEVRPQVNGIIKERRFKEGAEVSTDEVLYVIDPAPYQAAHDSAAAALQKADAMVPSAQAKADRYQGLSREKAVSQQDVDDAVAALAQAKAVVAAAKAELETARINLAYTQVKAPIAGRIGKSAFTVGALVTANQGDALAVIRELDPIYVDIAQSSANLLKLRRAFADGQLAIRSGSIPVRLILEDGTSYAHTGKLGFAEVKVDESTGTFTLRAQFENPDRLLLPGMYVRAVIEEGVSSGAFLVPQRGVGRNIRGEATAMFVGAGDKVEERVLKIRRGIGNDWLVESGVADGDRLIVEGTMKARRGQAVKPIEVTIDEKSGEIKRADAGGGIRSAAAAAPAAE
jgi:membrane fusion protein (multidrug efflux system)